MVKDETSSLLGYIGNNVYIPINESVQMDHTYRNNILWGLHIDKVFVLEERV